MGRQTGQGGSATGLLIVLGLAGALGAWNYQRNLALELEQREGSRPFQGYTDEALEQLAVAYGDQAEVLERRYQASLEHVAGVRNPDGLVMEKVEEFERVRQIGAAVRTATSEVADSEARLRQIRDEQSWRRDTLNWSLHLQRLTRI